VTSIHAQEGLSGVEHPWWEGFDIDICRTICTDTLHGLHKWFKDHPWSWTVKMVGKSETDTRFGCLPRTPGYRCFPGGISKISQWGGKDARNVERYAVAAVTGALHKKAVRALRADTDFIYSSDWEVFTEGDLTRLDEYTEQFHDNKSIFIHPVHGGRRGKDKKPMEHFNIPKLHVNSFVSSHLFDTDWLIGQAPYPGQYP
jgi:hypothetical protein